jgi:C1A family cysteine protease
MKSVVNALIVVSAAFGQDDLKDLWASWKQQYGKEYQDEVTEGVRFGIFSSNYERIQAWNNAGNTATLALNKFADLTNEEFGALYTGAFPTPSNIQDAGIVELDETAIPDTWDWRTQGAVTPVKNQGQCGSCWAFSTVACIEGLNKINGNTLTSFSEQQVVDCDKTCYGCDGGWPYLGFQYVATSGLETESDYPYTAETGTCNYNSGEADKNLDTGSSFVTPKNPTALKTAIYQQPVSVIVEADQDAFQFYSSGVITTGCGTALDHAITAIGYGTYSGQDAFWIKNSWGTDWGVEGYVYISTSTTYNSGLGACGVLSEPQYPKGIKN